MVDELEKERIKQIDELAEWATKNTNYNNITPTDAIKFFDMDDYFESIRKQKTILQIRNL